MRNGGRFLAFSALSAPLREFFSNREKVQAKWLPFAEDDGPNTPELLKPIQMCGS